MSKFILLVDDEPDVIYALKVSLEQAGYRVSTAENGQQALHTVANDRPDLILMDRMMPVMDGLEALRRLKDNPSTAHIPVVLLTGQDSYQDMEEGWKNGTDLYLTKPVFPAELLDYIRCILS
jgi:two-component system alkaline phosphatase synthesis response regulator PhoP